MKVSCEKFYEKVQRKAALESCCKSFKSSKFFVLDMICVRKTKKCAFFYLYNTFGLYELKTSNRNGFSQHLHIMENIFRNLLENNDVDVICPDFAEAFDKIDHEVLLVKLKSLGVKGRQFKWTKNFPQRSFTNCPYQSKATISS